MLKKWARIKPDYISAETLKVDLDAAAEILHSLFEKIWEEGTLTVVRKEDLITYLPKKGDLRDLKTRGIMLLSVPGRVLNTILQERMKAAADSKLRDNQAGFRRDRSCTEHNETLLTIIEQSLVWNSSLNVNSIDYEKAFDSVDRETL